MAILRITALHKHFLVSPPFIHDFCLQTAHVINFLHLLGGGHSNIQFNWPTRRKICIGVARGLAFLHEEVQPHIVHRDIKASNVLLDDELEPKISDFGLAKLFPANLTHISTNVAGTA